MTRKNNGVIALVLLAVAGLAVAIAPSGAFAATPAQGWNVVGTDDLSNDPEARGFAELLFARGRVALEDGDFAAAKADFLRAAETWPADASYVYYAGVATLRMGRPKDAIELLQQALPPAKTSIPPWRIHLDLATAFARAGRSAEARSELQAARVGNPSIQFEESDLKAPVEAEEPLAGESPSGEETGETVSEAGETPRFEIRGSLAVEYDSNPELLSGITEKLIVPELRHIVYEVTK